MIRRLGFLAVLSLFAFILLTFPAPSNAQKAKQFAYIDLYKGSEGDKDLARKLLKNQIAEVKRVSGVDPFILAKMIEFNGNSKAMMFVILEGGSACIWRGCETYVLVKNGVDEKWQYGLDTYAGRIWIDTRKQKTDFPRVVTQAPTKKPEYWLWNGKRYKGVHGG